jgi:hypothetical protein
MSIHIHIDGLCHCRPRTRIRWTLGPVTHITAADRGTPTPGGPPAPGHNRKADLTMQLQDDQKVDLAVTGDDDVNNAVAIAGTVVYSVDDPTILALTDNGDGTAVIAATGKLGTATVTVTDTETGGAQITGTLAVAVVTSSPTSVTITPGTPTHV